MKTSGWSSKAKTAAAAYVAYRASKKLRSRKPKLWTGEFRQESIRYFLKNLSDMVMKATNGWTTVQYNLVFHVYLTTEIIWLANDQVPQL